MKTLNLCYKTQFLEGNTCQFTKSPYLCIVFFIVLDFKVNKGWSTAVLLFYARTLNTQSAYRGSPDF